MHALIIEQDPWIVFMIEDALRECGCTSFDVAVTSEDAVKLSQLRCPELITSAFWLGTSDGFETVRTICAGSHIPVVFITSTAWEIRERNPNLAVIQKPFAPDALKAAVDKARGYSELEDSPI